MARPLVRRAVWVVLVGAIGVAGVLGTLGLVPRSPAGAPTDGSSTVAPPAALTVRRLPDIAYAAGARLDVYLPAAGPAAPSESVGPGTLRAGTVVVVLVHGCCGDRSDLAKLAEALAAAGAVVMNVGWPGINAEARYPGAYEAVGCAARFARARAASFGADPERVVLVGWSDGALVATTVAGTGDDLDDRQCTVRDVSARPRAVVGLNGFYGWRPPVPPAYVTARAVRFFGGTPRERPQVWLAATPWTALREAPTGGTWVLVGRTDPLLPDARRYATALRAVGRPVHLVEMAPDGDQSLISPRSPEGRLVVSTVVAAGGRH